LEETGRNRAGKSEEEREEGKGERKRVTEESSWTAFSTSSWR
jgi:hypothetical protein